MKYLKCLAVLLVATMAIIPSSVRAGRMVLGDVCRVRGQEVNTLQGLGLVVGLRGTGDNDSAPTARALARTMQLMGAPIGTDRTGQLNIEDVADAKNVALVVVTAKIPSVGAQQGDLIDVSVSALSAKSLEGGRLMSTGLLGPRTDDQRVYALAEGQLRVSPDGTATVATIEGGAKMESTLKAQFEKNGKITLVLDNDFADFDTVQEIERDINAYLTRAIGAPSLVNDNRGDEFGFGQGGALGAQPSYAGQSRVANAKAIDQLHLEVLIPNTYRSDPVKFVSLILETPIQITPKSNRVVINERKGIVVIGRDVEIAPVLITHRNLRIEAGGPNLVNVGQDGDPNDNAKLKSLADALNALDVQADDLIDIIKTLKAKGDLYGEVIFR